MTFRSIPETDGVLVIKQIIPNGPLSEWARVGDVLLSINGRSIGFVELDALLDAMLVPPFLLKYKEPNDNTKRYGGRRFTSVGQDDLILGVMDHLMMCHSVSTSL